MYLYACIHVFVRMFACMYKHTLIRHTYDIPFSYVRNADSATCASSGMHHRHRWSAAAGGAWCTSESTVRTHIHKRAPTHVCTHGQARTRTYMGTHACTNTLIMYM